MITPWVSEFLKAFQQWSLWFAASWLVLELIGFATIGTRYVWLNPLFVVTGYMGLFVGFAFYAASTLTLSIFYTEKRK